MDTFEYEAIIKELERENRIIKRKLLRSETNRRILEEILETHTNTLKVCNAEVEASLKMRDEFLSTISHEFKTPITVIDSTIQTMCLLCKSELSPKMSDYLCRIKQNNFRQLRLVDTLLEIMRPNTNSFKKSTGNYDIVFLSKSITDSIAMFAAQKNIKVSFISKIDKAIICIDEMKFERILLNLLSNALKFTPSGKEVTVLLSRKKSWISIRVKDQGIGIPQNKKELIFEKFGQVDSSLSRSSEGTGLGLYLVKKLVTALGGKISVQSKMGKGSTFILLLPDNVLENDKIQNEPSQVDDSRLVRAATIEFSDIYF